MTDKKKGIDIYLGEIKGEKMSDEQEKSLAERIAAGDEKATEELVVGNLRYVVKLARSYSGKGVAVEDLIGEGNIGMMRAAKRFKPSTGKRFAAFAAPFIREAMEDAIGRQEDPRRVIKDEGSVADTSAVLADEQMADYERQRKIEKALGVLDDRQRTVVSAFYGIGTARQSMAEIAENMGLKRERVRQIRLKAERLLCKENRQLKGLLRE